MSEPSHEPGLQFKLLREVHRAARIGTWEAKADNALLWSDETLELFGLARSEFRGTIDQFYSLIHVDDVERVKLVADFHDTGMSEFKSEYRIVRSDGEVRHIRQTAIVLRDAEGLPTGFSGVVQDVTEQVETEAKLRQAQKMELIGQLSGGVAHDFNNILAAIMGASELLQYERAYDDDLVDSIIQATKRGAELTKRLLAFARKQPLRTERFDVTQLIEQAAPLYDRLTGQDVRLELDLPEGTWTIEADPAPLEEALLNLVVNAFDALSGAGTIRISCANLEAAEPGSDGPEFVEISVTDTGHGMSTETRLKATEPFFTTKPVGKGSGLGLSMVEGYVRQSDGFLRLYSQLGRGTQVSMLLPRSKTQGPIAELGETGPRSGAGQTVLVIDDNADLAQLLVRQLSNLNYRATSVANAAAAIELTKREGGFDLVLADVLLSDGERGPDIAAQLMALYPKTKTVFMTGYSSPAEHLPDEMGEEFTVLRKPTAVDELAKALQSAKGL
ncbi:MAG: ATP-binding protein [Pseudomonadota bacterium]